MTSKAKASAGKGRPMPGSGIAAAVQQMPTATLLLITVTLLCIFGLVMVGSASSVISISLYGTPWAILVREAIWMAVGGLVLLFTIRFDYRKLRRWSPLLLLVTYSFNIVGDGNASEAIFNKSTAIEVRIAIKDGSTAAPTCATNAGTTGETNNRVLGACSALTGTEPSIEFRETGN